MNSSALIVSVPTFPFPGVVSLIRYNKEPSHPWHTQLKNKVRRFVGLNNAKKICLNLVEPIGLFNPKTTSRKNSNSNYHTWPNHLYGSRSGCWAESGEIRDIQAAGAFLYSIGNRERESVSEPSLYKHG